MFQDDQAKLKAGRISYADRLQILTALGIMAQEKYKYNLKNNHQGYNLTLLKNALQFEPNVDTFENHYYLETGSEKLNAIANYFEYGTGLNNTGKKAQGRRYIKSTTPGKYMKFEGTNLFEGTTVFTKKVRGVRPVFAMTKVIRDMTLNRVTYQRDLRRQYGIGVQEND